MLVSPSPTPGPENNTRTQKKLVILLKLDNKKFEAYKHHFATGSKTAENLIVWEQFPENV